MSSLINYYDAGVLGKLVHNRAGEQRIGQKAKLISGDLSGALAATNARYILLGIPEDIGVRANFGRPGAATAVYAAFEAILNLQSNAYFDGSSLGILGEIAVDDLSAKASSLDPADAADLGSLRAIVSEVDYRVAEIVKTIVSLNRIPIVIGGGHNNAYGCLKGTSLALGTKVNAINCDQHLDFRAAEGRHSGNAFSYAWNDGWLRRYSVYCMHEQYNNEHAIASFTAHPDGLHYCSYESVFVRQEVSEEKALSQCIGFVKGAACGVEVDLDAIVNTPSSARTSSGLDALQVRRFVHTGASALNAAYLHIAEGAPVLAHRKADNKTGKLIAYLVSDFVKGVEERMNGGK